MHRLSVIIPVLGNSSFLDDTLVSVLENRPANCEIIVVHNHPYHDPYNLSDEVRFVGARRGASLGECLNDGIAASGAPIVQVLGCGVEVCPDWVEAALPRFADPGIAAVGVAIADHDEHPKIYSIGWGYRVEGIAWRPGKKRPLEQAAAHWQELRGPDALAAFYRKDAVQGVGGFAKGVGEDLLGLDLAMALRQAGYQCVLEPACIAHIVSGMSGESAFQYGRHVERLFWRWASAQGLATSLAGHMALLAGQCVVGIVRPKVLMQLLGRFCGTIEAVFAKKRPGPIAAGLPQRPIVAPPHFAIPSVREKRHSSRVA